MKIRCFVLSAAIALASVPSPAPAQAPNRPADRDAADSHTPATPAVPMNMEEPMDSAMMRQGMKKGDVKKAAAAKDAKMKKMLEMEEKAMPPMPPETRQR
jgi:hypothetical protein